MAQLNEEMSMEKSINDNFVKEKDTDFSKKEKEEMDKLCNKLNITSMTDRSLVHHVYRLLRTHHDNDAATTATTTTSANTTTINTVNALLLSKSGLLSRIFLSSMMFFSDIIPSRSDNQEDTFGMKEKGGKTEKTSSRSYGRNQYSINKMCDFYAVGTDLALYLSSLSVRERQERQQELMMQGNEGGKGGEKVEDEDVNVVNLISACLGLLHTDNDKHKTTTVNKKDNATTTTAKCFSDDLMDLFFKHQEEQNNQNQNQKDKCRSRSRKEIKDSLTTVLQAMQKEVKVSVEAFLDFTYLWNATSPSTYLLKTTLETPSSSQQEKNESPRRDGTVCKKQHQGGEEEKERVWLMSSIISLHNQFNTLHDHPGTTNNSASTIDNATTTRRKERILSMASCIALSHTTHSFSSQQQRPNKSQKNQTTTKEPEAKRRKTSPEKQQPPPASPSAEGRLSIEHEAIAALSMMVSGSNNSSGSSSPLGNVTPPSGAGDAGANQELNFMGKLMSSVNELIKKVGKGGEEVEQEDVKKEMDIIKSILVDYLALRSTTSSSQDNNNDDDKKSDKNDSVSKKEKIDNDEQDTLTSFLLSSSTTTTLDTFKQLYRDIALGSIFLPKTRARAITKDSNNKKKDENAMDVDNDDISNNQDDDPSSSPFNKKDLVKFAPPYVDETKMMTIFPSSSSLLSPQESQFLHRSSLIRVIILNDLKEEKMDMSSDDEQEDIVAHVAIYKKEANKQGKALVLEQQQQQQQQQPPSVTTVHHTSAVNTAKTTLLPKNQQELSPHYTRANAPIASTITPSTADTVNIKTNTTSSSNTSTISTTNIHMNQTPPYPTHSYSYHPPPTPQQQQQPYLPTPSFNTSPIITTTTQNNNRRFSPLSKQSTTRPPPPPPPPPPLQSTVLTDKVELHNWTDSLLSLSSPSSQIKPSTRLMLYLDAGSGDDEKEIQKKSAAAAAALKKRKSKKEEEKEEKNVMGGGWRDVIVPILNRVLTRLNRKEEEEMLLHEGEDNGSNNSSSRGGGGGSLPILGGDSSSSTATTGGGATTHVVSKENGELNSTYNAATTSDVDDVMPRALVVLYYHTLESILYNETKRLKSASHPRLVQNSVFHKALLSCSCLCLLKATGGGGGSSVGGVGSGGDVQRDLKKVLKITDCTPYEYMKISESFVRGLQQLDHSHNKSHQSRNKKGGGDGGRISGCLPVILRRHLRGMEEYILDSLLWTSPPPTSIMSRVLKHGNDGGSKQEEDGKGGGLYMKQVIKEVMSIKGEWPLKIVQPTLPEEMEDAEDGKSSGTIKPTTTTTTPSKNNNNTSTTTQPQEHRHPEYAFLTYVLRKLQTIACHRISTLCQYLAIPPSYPLAKQVYISFRYLLRHNLDLLYDRHVDQLLLCSIYGVSKIMKYKPELSFSKIIEVYTALNKDRLGHKACQKIIRQIKLYNNNNDDDNNFLKNSEDGSNNTFVMDMYERRKRKQQQTKKSGNVIHLYNQIYVPSMKKYLLGSKSLKRAVGELKTCMAEQSARSAIQTVEDATFMADQVSSPRLGGGGGSSGALQSPKTIPPAGVLGGGGRNSVRVPGSNMYLTIPLQSSTAGSVRPLSLAVSSQQQTQQGRSSSSRKRTAAEVLTPKTRALYRFGGANAKDVSLINETIKSGDV